MAKAIVVIKPLQTAVCKRNPELESCEHKPNRAVGVDRASRLSRIPIPRLAAPSLLRRSFANKGHEHSHSPAKTAKCREAHAATRGKGEPTFFRWAPSTPASGFPLLAEIRTWIVAGGLHTA